MSDQPEKTIDDLLKQHSVDIGEEYHKLHSDKQDFQITNARMQYYETKLRAALSAMVAEIIGEDVAPYIDPFMGDRHLSGKDHHDNNIKNDQRQRAAKMGFRL